MADISFSCPACSGAITVDEKCSGTTVSCPHCSAPVTFARTKKTATKEECGVTWEFCSEQTVITTTTTNQCSTAGNGKAALEPIRPVPGKNGLAADVVVQLAQPPHGSSSKTFRVQGCLPLLVIGIGVLVSMRGTLNEDDTTFTIGAALVLAGIVWAGIAHRMPDRSTR